MKTSGVVAAAALMASLAVSAAADLLAQAQPPAVPRPFPNSGAPKPDAPATARVPPPTAVPAAAAVDRPAPAQSAPAAATAQLPPGTPVYPTAEFIDAYDAGAGQRYYLFGTNAAYNDIVAYYRSVLKNGGRELFKIPPAQQFDLGRFDSDTMVYPPSVVVKDYTWNSSPGYLAVSGTTEKRYKTIIQIVPPGPGR
ncbi:MAG: hypothetical protein IT184_07705 [Acidobacteria bacterium]|nr:hypothetical protein [Acidobacteriota bacterium]